MIMRYNNKIMLFLCSFVLFALVVTGISLKERKYCMGVPVISEEHLKEYTEIDSLDISQLIFDGQPIAVDWIRKQVYISQSSHALKKIFDLQGEIGSENSKYELFMLNTPALKDIRASVKNGKSFTLIIKSGTFYQKVPMVITTMPVMFLKLEGTGEDEQGRSIMRGKLTLWNSGNPKAETYQTTTSYAEWRMRGNSTRTFPKLAWKVNLRDEIGQNNNADFLGLGSDDDWILNPMSMDDTFVKEKLVQTLWSQLISKTDYNYKMSQGEYVELFINGAYQGIYLLQRRIDAKYLELNKEKDVLLKGINTWEAESIPDAYEIVSTPLEHEKSYEILKQAMMFEDGNMINASNFIDVSLLLQFISGIDNYGYKNTFYVLKDKKGSYELYFVPWDTDLSLGVTWGYDYEESMNEIIERYELPVMKREIDVLDAKFVQRWKELRQGIYSEENVLGVYKELTEQLSSSGAIERDEEQWGLLHDGEDNWQNLEYFIKERLLFLDEYYLKLEN